MTRKDEVHGCPRLTLRPVRGSRVRIPSCGDDSTSGAVRQVLESVFNLLSLKTFNVGTSGKRYSCLI